jgi:hypothetical protein
MAGIYRAEIRAYEDLKQWGEFFLELPECLENKETKEGQ